MAMIVRPVAPVRAVKTAHARSAIIDTPPGSQPSNALESLTSRLGAPLSERRYPANVKSGMATRIGVVAIRVHLDDHRRGVYPAEIHEAEGQAGNDHEYGDSEEH